MTARKSSTGMDTRPRESRLALNFSGRTKRAFASTQSAELRAARASASAVASRSCRALERIRSTRSYHRPVQFFGTISISPERMCVGGQGSKVIGSSRTPMITLRVP